MGEETHGANQVKRPQLAGVEISGCQRVAWQLVCSFVCVRKCVCSCVSYTVRPFGKLKVC